MDYDHIGGFIALALGILIIYAEYRIKQDDFQSWFWELNIIPCKCGCKDDHWNVKDTVSGHVCEAEVICDNCGAVVNYWAYGNTEFPVTYTELFKRKIEAFKRFCNPIQQYKNWKFNRSFNKRGFK